eukprot:scaffold2910_cov390-Prasinococcus_capsulatus_cf.AAC.17
MSLASVTALAAVGAYVRQQYVSPTRDALATPFRDPPLARACCWEAHVRARRSLARSSSVGWRVALGVSPRLGVSLSSAAFEEGEDDAGRWPLAEESGGSPGTTATVLRRRLRRVTVMNFLPGCGLWSCTRRAARQRRPGGQRVGSTRRAGVIPRRTSPPEAEVVQARGRARTRAPPGRPLTCTYSLRCRASTPNGKGISRHMVRGA